MIEEAFQFLYYRPHPVLRKYIKNYLFIRDPFLFSHDQLLLPDTEYMMVINLGDLVSIKRIDGASFRHNPYSALLFSHYDKCFRVESTNLFCIVIHFYPLGLYHFLKQSLSSIPLNSYLNIDSLAGLSLQQIVDDGCSEKQDSEIICLIERFLLKHFSAINSKDDVLRSALTLLNQYHCHMSIESLSKLTCSTYRQLDRKFSEQVGFAPKQYAKVVRFRKAFDQLMKQKEGNMIQIVAEQNYYDQMHLIKDFKKFTSYTPTQLIEINKKESRDLHALYADHCNSENLT